MHQLDTVPKMCVSVTSIKFFWAKYLGMGSIRLLHLMNDMPWVHNICKSLTVTTLGKHNQATTSKKLIDIECHWCE